MSRPRRARRRVPPMVPTILLLVSLALVLTGVGESAGDLLAGSRPSPAGTSGLVARGPGNEPRSSSPPAAAAGTSSSRQGGDAAASSPATSPPARERVRVGALGIDADIEQMSATGTEVPVPLWGAGLVRFGDVTVLTGHLYVGNRPGSFATLHQARPGMVVEIVQGRRVRAYRIAAVEVHRKGHLPGWVFRSESGDRLVLITCTGPVGTVALADGTTVQEPLDNLVVFAEPLG